MVGIKNETNAVLNPSNHQVITKLNINGTISATMVQPTIKNSTSLRILLSHLEFPFQIINSIWWQKYFFSLSPLNKFLLDDGLKVSHSS